jgi:hypothetical protein
MTAAPLHRLSYSAAVVLLALWPLATSSQAQSTIPPILAPVHESFRPPIASISASQAPVAPPPDVPDQSPPPESQPDAKWIPGYWDYRPDLHRFLWVDGVWRVPPPGRTWVESYWARSTSRQTYERVAGFWARADRSAYESEGPPKTTPPEPDPGPAPSPDRLYIAGHYAPSERALGVEWKPGFWSQAQPGWTWIPAAWLERPSGWAFQKGYWMRDDLLSTPPRGRLITLTADQVEATRKAQGAAVAAARAREAAAGGGPAATSGAPSLLEEVAAIQSRVLTPVYASTPTTNQRRPGGAPVAGAGGGAPWLITPNSGLAAGSTPAPSQGQYLGQSLPGMSYPSWSSTPNATNTSTYVGAALPGMSYPSWSSTPNSTGSSFYIGNSGPGQSYGTWSTTNTSVGNYGYGTPQPGAIGGQPGTSSP